MADASKYEDNIKKYAKGYNQAAAEKIVGHLGIALRNRDSSLVSCCLLYTSPSPRDA